MELVNKNIKILDQDLSVGMTDEFWSFVEVLQNNPDYAEHSNIENLFLIAYLECKKSNCEAELGSVIMEWLYEANTNKNEHVLGFLRPFPRSEVLVSFSS